MHQLTLLHPCFTCFARLFLHPSAGEPLFYESEAGGPHAEHVITEDDDEVGFLTFFHGSHKQPRVLLGISSCHRNRRRAGSPAFACFTTNRATSAGKKAAAQRAKSVMSLVACATLTRSRCAPRFPQVVAMIKELLETRIRPAVQVRQ